MATDAIASELRDLINTPRRHADLRRDERLFDQLCSALDVIGDTAAALHAYTSSAPAELSVGERYLRTYGVLQVLVVQQDALGHLGESLSIQYHQHEDLEEIRKTRNDAVGHPSFRGKKTDPSFNHISQVTLSHEGFTLLTFRPGKPQESRTIDLLSLIERQRKLVDAALREFVDHEVRRETEHRQTFRSIRLVAALPQSLDYTLQKIAEEIEGPDRLGIATSLLASVPDAIAEFERQLTERGELPAIEDAFSHHARPARHALERLHEFFTPARSQSVTRDDAETFLFRLKHALAELRDLAREIDDSYASEPPT